GEIRAYVVDSGDRTDLAIGQLNRRTLYKRSLVGSGIRDRETGRLAIDTLVPIGAGEVIQLHRDAAGWRWLRRGSRRWGVGGTGNSADSTRSADFITVEQTTVNVDAEVLTHYVNAGDLADLAVSKLDLYAGFESSNRTGTCRN